MIEDKDARKVRILERVSDGTLSSHTLELAAYLGDPDAKWTALGRAVIIPSDFKAWMSGMNRWRNNQAVARAILSLARQCCHDYEQRMPAELKTLKTAMRELIVVTEACLTTAHPSEEQSRQLIELTTRLDEEPMLLVEQNGLLDQASRLSLALTAVLALSGDSEQALHDATHDALQLWPDGEALIRDVISNNVCPWLLGESDPIRDHPTAPPS